MLNTAGAFILVLYLNNGHGLATHEFPNFESCKAAIVQLRVDSRVSGYCIAKEVLE